MVQIYVHDREAEVKQPFKELKRFERANLLPGETKILKFCTVKYCFHKIHTHFPLSPLLDFSPVMHILHIMTLARPTIQ
ncbi:MAG: fibronectin type III-like domain-contianing protein [Spirochaetales bacterium]|nr:fibronectin type III-like domain-contianing protein [Spirochaetales bacterium]